jgi:hypothetical protein
MPAVRVPSVVFAAISLALAVACGGSSSPAAAPTPTPPPATLPEPPTPPVGCGAPPNAGSGYECVYRRAQYAEDVNVAIARVVLEHPEYFDLGQRHNTWSYFVKEPNLYLMAVVRNLEQAGFCAMFDGAEIALKRSNDFSEQYDVYTSTGFSRWGGGAYAATCHPAWF